MVITEVPLNTMLADLDETIRDLLKRELGRHGFEGIEIAFEAPTREWSGQLSQPSVNLFLYDIREDEDGRASAWRMLRQGDRAMEGRPPMVIEASYAVTAWAQAVEDEHRLLSQVLAVLFAFPELPKDMLNGRLRNGHQPYAIRARVGQPKGDKADFWTAVGGQYKASLDYVVKLAVDPGVRSEGGPMVRTQTIRTRLVDGPASSVLEMHRAGGVVVDADGEGLANVWVTLPDSGRWTASDGRGRFSFERMEPGIHRVLARTADGREAAGELRVPGEGTDLVIEEARAARSGRGSGRKG